MKRAAPIVAGTMLLIASMVGFVGVPEHRPGSRTVGLGCIQPCHGPHTGLSQMLHDALRIATVAALIVGALLVIIGLINFARAPKTFR